MKIDPVVLICGAGPAGLTLALELARFGVPFRIVDRAFAPARYSQALTIQARTLELLEPAGVTDLLMRHMHRATGLHVRDGARTIAEIGFRGMPTAYDFIGILPQRSTEHAMLERLSLLGIEVERGVALTGLTMDADGCSADLAHTGGRERARFRYVAACDGADSTIRKLLTVPLRAHPTSESFIVADCELDTSLPNDMLTLALGSASNSLMFVPMGTAWRIIATSHAPAPDRPHVEYLHNALAQLPLRGLTLRGVSWIAAFTVRQQQVEHYRFERTFFLGDAAHIHSPLGGQGMNSGIHDAVNLAWKLALVIRDAADPALLDTYAEERSGVGSVLLGLPELGWAGALRANPVVRTMRDRAIALTTRFDPARSRLRENIAQLRVAYPHSRLSVHGRSHRSGTVAGTRIRGVRPSGYRPRIIMTPGAEDRVTTIVLRPDGYVGYVADGKQHTGAQTYLERVVGLRS